MQTSFSLPRKLLSLFLVLLLVLPTLCLTACMGGDDTPPPPTDPSNPTLAQALKDEGYTLVYPDPESRNFTTEEHAYINEARILIAEAYQSLTGQALPQKEDYVRRGNPIPQNAKEILLGETNRASSTSSITALRANRQNNANDWQILMGNQEVNIISGEAMGIRAAAQAFVAMLSAPVSTYSLGGYASEINIYTWPLATIGGVPTESYRIVYPHGAPAAFLNQVNALKDAIYRVCGLTLTAVDDTTPAQQYEICVGHTNRAVSATALSMVNALRNNNYLDHVLYSNGGNIAIMPGEDSLGLEKAVEDFCSLVTSASMATTLNINQSYRKPGLVDLTFGGIAAGKFQLVLPKDAPIDLVYNAKNFAELVKTRTGYLLPIVYDDAPKANYEILLGKVDRTASTTVAKDVYKTSVVTESASSTHFVVDAGHYYGVACYFKELKTLLMGNSDVHITGSSTATVPAGITSLDLTTDFTTASGVTIDVAPGTVYDLAWNDEFDDLWDSGWINTEKWSGRWSMYYPDDVKPLFNKDVVKVDDGILTLVTDEYEPGSRQNPVDGRYRYKMPNGVVTSNTLNYKYGYLEMRAAPPYYQGGSGQFPSFWATSGSANLAIDFFSGKANNPWDNTNAPYELEIDFFEIFGGEKNCHPNLHKWMSGGGHHQLSTLDKEGGSANGVANYGFSSTAVANQFHTYSFLWTENVMMFAVDRQFYWSYSIADSGNFGGNASGTMEGFRTQYLDIILNNMLFTEEYDNGGWMADRYTYLRNEHLPILYEVDYMRYYRTGTYGDYITKTLPL